MSGHASAVSTPTERHLTTGVEVPLPHGQQAPGQARRFAREVLLRWRLPGLVDAVVLTVSELVTNAVRYGRPAVSLELARSDGELRVGVHDGDPAEPPGRSAAAAQDGAESGRGLGIVQTLAADVAFVQVPDDGKVVYASFPVEPADPDTSG